MSKIVVFIISLLVCNSVLSHEPPLAERTDLMHVLEAFSARTGVKFVTDPRVKAKVNTVGLKLDEIGQEQLNKILLMHSFVAYQNNGVVYVIPQVIEQSQGAQYGIPWQQ
ncbi:MAG: hypothetical protein HKN50_07690 [Gammaproteobacteria bacterium]|nr:hypothetical protein [Gammaproteobacteria bacterium]